MMQSIEEAWSDAEQWFMEGQDDLRDAVRALAVATFWAGVNVGGAPHIDVVAERRRIEELGR